MSHWSVGRINWRYVFFSHYGVLFSSFIILLVQKGSADVFAGHVFAGHLAGGLGFLSEFVFSYSTLCLMG